MAVADRGSLSGKDVHAHTVQIAEFNVALKDNHLEQAVQVTEEEIRAHDARNSHARVNLKFRVGFGCERMRP